MSWTRRAVIKGLGAGGIAVLASGRLPLAAATEAGPIVLEAKPGSAQLLEPPVAPTQIWGYGGRVPGPILRVKQGEEVWFRLKNSLPEDGTTIHWHGVRLDNRMDGVAHLTQEAVPAGETFDYRFVAPDAGTFWYHPHHLSWEQVARGLYGALIVEEREPVDVDQDIVLIVDDWRLEDSGQIHEASFGALHDRAHAGRLGNVVTVNGLPEAKLPVTAGERVRLRLVNTCNARILDLRFEDVVCEIVARDGQPVAPVPLKDGRITIAPGQRIDLAVDMTAAPGAEAAIAEVSQERLVIGAFVHAAKPSPARARGRLVLPANAIPEPDLGALETVDLVMAGGAMGMMNMSGMMHKGRMTPIQELAQEDGQVWAFNGVAGMPDKPLFSAPRGRSMAVRIVNQTRWPHAMHFHGHHFREIGPEAPSPAPWHDTFLVEPMETRTVAFVADNPGKWMLHCHMLEHQAGGMGTWFEVT